jgi:hypothetical protein
MMGGTINMPDMQKVANSSNVDAIGYEKDIHTVYVRFLSGGTYKVHPVDESMFKAFESSTSKGSFFSKVFKGNTDYKIEQV